MSSIKIKLGAPIHQITERIEKLREEKGIKSMTQFCQEIGFSKSSYGNYVNVPKSGKAITPSIDLLEAINKRWPTVNLHYMVTGDGTKEVISEEERLKQEIEVVTLRNDARENLDLSEKLMKKYVDLQKERDELQTQLNSVMKELNIIKQKVN